MYLADFSEWFCDHDFKIFLHFWLAYNSLAVLKEKEKRVENFICLGTKK